MNELAEFCKNLKKDFTPRSQDTKKPVKFWSEKDFLSGDIVDAFVIIFRTRGCSWALKSGCSMCGYFNDSIWKNVPDDDLLNQFNTAMESYSGQGFVKIFTSGSFLDDKEIKPKVRKEILGKLAETTDKISVESRPEFISNEKLTKIKKTVGSKNFEVGIGLETADDHIREFCVNKGFTFKDYTNAAKIVKKYGFDLKTYVLIKPPFLTEKESINDAINTVNKIKTLTDTVSFNPTNVQRNTLVEFLWKKRQYRPAWLWSVVEILKESKKLVKNNLLKCDIAGGGSIRGAHNCKNCDRMFLDAINKFSLSQDTSVFKDINCDCKEQWLDQIDIEDLGFGSLVNMYG
jgi:radical SAM enzyme (TIGR01210 family)